MCIVLYSIVVKVSNISLKKNKRNESLSDWTGRNGHKNDYCTMHHLFLEGKISSIFFLKL